jgi:hypothetical protein
LDDFAISVGASPSIANRQHNFRRDFGFSDPEKSPIGGVWDVATCRIRKPCFSLVGTSGPARG